MGAGNIHRSTSAMLCRGLLRNACRAGLLPGARTAPRHLAPAAALRSFGSGGDPRGHLNPDGTRPEAEDIEGFHEMDPMDHVPPQDIVKERGQMWVKPFPRRSIDDLYGCHQERLPFWPRQRLLLFGNYKLLMKVEYLFFYIPTIVVLGLVIPAFTSIYTVDELVDAAMTIKVTARQWYWVYEIESPTDGDED